MSSVFAKTMFATGCLGLVAAVEMPLDPWLQLGVAGVSLFILFWVITKTHPAHIKELTESNERNIKSIVDVQRQVNDQVLDMLSSTLAEKKR